MPNFTKNPSWKSSPSFALISVLALVSLAALTATAFLASARLERQATSSIGTTTRLEMALNSGKVCVSQVINDNSQSDVGGNTTIVTYWRTNWTDEFGYPFIGQTKLNSAIWRYQPLFSPAGVTNLDTNVIQTAMRFTNFHQGTFSSDMQTFMTQNATNGFVATPGLNHPKCVQIPLLGGRTSPPVGWVYLNQEKRKLGSALTNTSPAVRIAWFTEDLEGLIDAERMGGLTTRPSGTNSEEISLSSATGTNGPLLSSVATFTNNRKAYISYGLLASANVSGIANPTNARYFASGLRAWAPTTAALDNGALAWIPAGIPISGSSTAPKGYSNQGYTKLNLNKLVSGSSAVATIAAVITNNLPAFGNRGGAMNSGAYISNIAANIVDYVDSDSIPNTDTANPPAWRGVENIAWPNEVFTRFNLTDRQIDPANPANYLFKLGVKQYIEVWNLGSKSLVVDGTNYSVVNNLNIPLNCTNWNSNLKSADPATPPASEACTNAPFTLPANSYGVISALTRTFNITVPINLAPGTTTPMLKINPSTSFNKYTISYSNKIIDATPVGRWLGSFTNMRVGDFHFITTAVNFGTSANGSAFNLAGGDPRGGLFVMQPAMDFRYNYTSPGGRNVDNNPITVGGAKYVDPKVNWVDRGHSLGNTGADIATPPTSAAANNSIAQGLVKQGNPNHWVQKINTSINGTFINVMELGNIFDPIQWGDPYNPFHPRDNAAWMGLSNSATATNAACGRNTLRIGRAEHQLFAFTNMYGNSVPSIPNMGMSPAALLDLFCLTNGTNVSGGPYSLGGGKINLNTAPAPVLRALAGGVLLTNDPALVNNLSQIAPNHSVPAGMSEAFAQGVMRFRSKYPFLTPSHLSFIGTDPDWPNTNTWPSNAVFGNTNSIALTNAPGNSATSTRININEWNDQVAEEWFSKIYAISSCQSQNYRIYVVAQLVATNSLGETNAIGPLVKKYYQIYARNGSSTSRLATDSTYPNNPIYTWQPTVGVIDVYKSTY